MPSYHHTKWELTVLLVNTIILVLPTNDFLLLLHFDYNVVRLACTISFDLLFSVKLAFIFNTQLPSLDVVACEISIYSHNFPNIQLKYIA